MRGPASPAAAAAVAAADARRGRIPLKARAGVAGGRCAAAGCGRFVKASEVWCGDHADEGMVAEAAGIVEFRRRLASGDYRTLFGPELVEVLAQAAAEQGLADEIGALRVTLARLLNEEADPAKLATSVARVAAVAVQAARAQQAIGDAADGPADELALVLDELGKG